jgi:putative ATPase
VREVIDDAKSKIFSVVNLPFCLLMKFIGLMISTRFFASRGEKGWIVLIGATTENPSFEVVSALLSRSQVYILKSLSYEKLEELAEISLKNLMKKLLSSKLQTKKLLLNILVAMRKLINSIELVLVSSKIQEKDNYQRRCAFGFARNNGTL